MEDFQNEIEDLVADDRLDDALIRLKEAAKEKKSDISSEIAIIKGELKDLRRDETLGLYDFDKLAQRKNRVRKSITDLAKKLKNDYILDNKNKYQDEVLPPETIPKNKKYKSVSSLLLTGLVIFVLLLYLLLIRPQNLPAKECNAIKIEAQIMLNQVFEKHKANTNLYDDFRYIAIEEDLKNHINLTTCDSLERIKKSIEFAREFINTK